MLFCVVFFVISGLPRSIFFFFFFFVTCVGGLSSLASLTHLPCPSPLLPPPKKNQTKQTNIQTNKQTNKTKQTKQKQTNKQTNNQPNNQKISFFFFSLQKVTKISRQSAALLHLRCWKACLQPRKEQSWGIFSPMLRRMLWICWGNVWNLILRRELLARML